ncbi:MAG: cytochrome c [Candidatus Acidiferrales bacterium]
MTARRIIVFLAFFVSSLFCAGAQQNAQTHANRPAQTNAKPAPAMDGEKVYKTQCGRCHNPPEDISPREVRAVVRQMRVRAMLSAEDEKLLLRYFAP